MSEVHSYNHPPIVEAIFDVFTESPLAIELDAIEKLHSQISDQYTKPQPRHQFESKFEIRDGNAVNSETINLGVDGYLFWANDHCQVVQFRKDGFSFNRLKPYQGWDGHFPEVLKLWEIFSRQFRPSAITRTALRFINQIEIPDLQGDLKKYLKNPPQAPDAGNMGSIENFISKIQIAFQGSNVKVNVTQTYGQKIKPNVRPLILDIDAYSVERYESETDQVAGVFRTLRSVKNTVFRQSITEETEALFQ